MSEVRTFITESFITESGVELKQAPIAYHTWGELNKNKDNVILVCHAFSGNSNVEDWFPGLFAEDSIYNPDEHFLVCINNPGSCYGTVDPWSINPDTGKAYQADFPVFSIRDIVRFQQIILDHLGIEGIEIVLGPSMGGMIALEFVIMDKRIKRGCFMGMGKSHNPWAIAIGHSQRMAIYADENWNGGWYEREKPPAKGLAAARAMAMVSYRTPQNYNEKFGREYHADKKMYQVESYLEYQGRKLVDRFDALTYVLLTKSMDTHDVSRGRGTFEEVLGNLEIPVLVLGMNSDVLYPTNEQKELADLLPNAQYDELHSPYGHDAFLIEFDQLNQHINNFFEKTNEADPIKEA